MKEDIKVGIADYKITKSPNNLITLGLGSCVGIAVYDKKSEVGGLSHIMLPYSSQYRKVNKVAKYADLALPEMIEKLVKNGARKNRLVAKIAGGASMFQFSDKNPKLNIGQRNIEAVKEILKDMKIPIKAEDVGGTLGRTMIVDLEKFEVSIKQIGKGIKNI